MKLVAFLSLSLVLAGQGFAEPRSSGRASCETLPSVSAAEDTERHILVQAGQAYEVLKNSAAFHYLADKRLRNPARFVGMGRDLASRGYRPTDKIVVLRSIGPASNFAPHASPIVHAMPMSASTTYQNSQGEQIFWSWDDGDDSTWEGSQYVERYSDGAWVTLDGQLDISNTDGNVLWASGTGGSGGPLNQDASHIVPERPLPSIGFAVGPSGWIGNLRSVQENQDPEPLERDWRERFHSWAACIISGCMGCAGGCLFTGPIYPECYGACCFGVSIACAIDFYFGP